MYSIREGLIYLYLKNRNTDEYYDTPSDETAGYWLYHAPDDPLGEFDRSASARGMEIIKIIMELG